MNKPETHITRDSFELHELMNAFIKRWYWFILAGAIGFGVSKWYTSKLSKIHQVQSVVLIDDSTERTVLRENPVPGLSLSNRAKRIENEIAILSSKDIMEEAVDRTQAFITCFVNNEEVYLNELPVRFNCSRIQNTSVSTYPIDFRHLSDSTFELLVGNAESKERILAVYGKEVFLKAERLVITKRLDDVFWSGEERPLNFTFYLNPFDNMVAGFRRKLEVFETARNSDGIMLRINETLPARGIDLQQEIIQNYLLGMDEQRKEMAQNAFDFIEGRLATNFDNLDSLEIIMEEYRLSKNMISPDKKIDHLYEGIKDFKVELSDAQTQLDITTELLSAIENNDNELSVPHTALGVQDPLLNDLLISLAKKESEREEMRETVHPNNPLFKQLNNQIAELRSSMHDDLKKFKRNLQISVQDIESRIAENEFEIMQLSGNNRELDGLERKRNIMEDLYNYLLKRREEAALVAAAELIDTWIIEKPHVETSFFKPKKGMVILVGVLLALLIPATLVGYRVMFNKRVNRLDDVRSGTNIPVLSSIGKASTGPIVGRKNKESRTEDFKALYFNLQFLSPSAKRILFTSPLSGEGKTHCAINYAMTLAALGRKTCLVELDTRNPSFIDRLEISSDRGVLNVLDGTADLKEVVKRSSFSSELQLITAGTSDQDPLRLLMSDAFNKLIQALSDQYDHVIMDAPPSMVMADVLVLTKQADLNIFVIREDVTPLSELSTIQEMHDSQQIHNMALLYNSDSQKKRVGKYYRKRA